MALAHLSSMRLAFALSKCQHINTKYVQQGKNLSLETLGGGRALSRILSRIGFLLR